MTTGVAGILGLPFPNGLIPQAPFHTSSLCATRQVRVATKDSSGEPEANLKTERVVDHVVEQRVSNLAQGLLTLGSMTGPLLIVVGLIPQGVLAGLFFTMGSQALAGNGIVLKLIYLLSDPELKSGHPLHKLERQWAIWLFVGCELFFFGAAIAVTQTIAAIGFPIILLAPIPFRVMVMPKLFRKEELEALDAPTASPFTMESVGGQHGVEAVPLGADPTGNGDDDDGHGHGESNGTDTQRRNAMKRGKWSRNDNEDTEDDIRFKNGVQPSQGEAKVGPGGKLAPAHSNPDLDPWRL